MEVSFVDGPEIVLDIVQLVKKSLLKIMATTTSSKHAFKMSDVQSIKK